MLRTHTPYAAEYRRRLVELARAGRSVTALARECKTSVETWRRGDRLALAVIAGLHRENRVLREEREIAAPNRCRSGRTQLHRRGTESFVGC
jgi:hypothetical protein